MYLILEDKKSHDLLSECWRTGEKEEDYGIIWAKKGPKCRRPR